MIYLDSAATSLQKPEAVRAAVNRAMRRFASPGRGSHAAARDAADAVFACRSAAAALFGLDTPEKVVFTQNATHALNIAVFSLVRPGDRVVVSGYEHNAVIRPLHALGAQVDIARSGLFDEAAAVRAFEERLQGARCAVCTHVSNVFGFILPISRSARLCRDARVPVIIDASQSAGCLPVHCGELGAAFVAMPGHKGLLGPQGTGLLLCGESGEPVLFGGTGSASASRDMPPFLPDRLEAGTHNVAGIAGLLAGIEAVQKFGTESILRHEQKLTRLMGERLQRIPGLHVFLSSVPSAQAGVLSIETKTCSCEALAESLGERGVAVRSGLHCSPCAHETAGTLKSGTLRFSFSPFNTESEVRRAADLTESIVKKL